MTAEETYLRQITDDTANRFFYRADLSPLPADAECTLRGHLAPDDEKRLCAMLQSGEGTAEMTLIDFPFGNYGYALVVPCFARVYLVLYPFKERKSRDAFPPRLRSVVSAIAVSAATAAQNELFSSVAVSEMLSECTLLSEGADEPTDAYYDLSALLRRFAEAMRRTETILDARIVADIGNERLLPIPLSLPHFCKILTLLISAMAPLSASRTVGLSLAGSSGDVRLVRLTTDLPDSLAALGRTEDMLFLAVRLRDAALPLLVAERIAARCGYVLTAASDDGVGTFSLTLRLSAPEGEIPEFRFRDPFETFDETFADAVYFASGKRPETLNAFQAELPK